MRPSKRNFLSEEFLSESDDILSAASPEQLARAQSIVDEEPISKSFARIKEILKQMEKEHNENL
jgi:hypothetical protein